MSRPYRQELKFVVHHSVKTLLLERWRRYLVQAPFTNHDAVTPVLSQYYDSPGLHFCHEKLDGIGLRNKVRLRVYDLAFRAGATAFLEVKHRDHDRVRKYRHQIKEFDASYLEPARWVFDGAAVEAAFRLLLEQYRLRPSAQVFYQREAYEGVVERDVRVTFDTQLMALHPGERLTRRILHDPCRRLMAETLAILEVKATHGIPHWLREGVLAAELQQQTLSKYVTAVEALGLMELSVAGVYAYPQHACLPRPALEPRRDGSGHPAFPKRLHAPF